MSEPSLSITDLQKRYGSTVALDRVSFQVAEGEMFGLLGPNGAGKTTLLSIVSCLLEPTAGEARIWGRPVHPADRELRRQIGIVPQELALYDELSGRDNLAFFGRLYGLTGAGLRRRVTEVLAAVGLEHHADHRVATFSGGMKRRLNLGASLVHRPRLLLLDEPTTGVDPQSRNHIFQEIRCLNRAGVTIVYTSHYMEEVQALCTRVGILDHGRLIACDAVPVLLRQMDGRILFRVAEVTPALRQRIGQLPDVRLVERDGRPLELVCHDVRATLVRLMTALGGLNVEVLGLETEEPNLERVFLGLTGSALRD
jgi:linearmycin/streptolysin S transport system ATP-binding protein